MNLASYTDSDERRFIRLIDGGVSDNLGVRGPFEGRCSRGRRGARGARISAPCDTWSSCS
ncbi:MAG: hypothetical protein R3E53_17480 [Myxococcota bacterium]